MAPRTSPASRLVVSFLLFLICISLKGEQKENTNDRLFQGPYDSMQAAAGHIDSSACLSLEGCAVPSELHFSTPETTVSANSSISGFCNTSQLTSSAAGYRSRAQACKGSIYAGASGSGALRRAKSPPEPEEEGVRLWGELWSRDMTSRTPRAPWAGCAPLA